MINFPTRQSFGRVCVMAFGATNVKYFCCGRERHGDGTFHYHVSILLVSSVRWFSAKKYLSDNHGIIVHFCSTEGGMYAGAYGYVTKTDVEPFVGHVLAKHPNREDIGKNVGPARANRQYRVTRAEANAAAASAAEKKKAAKPERRMDKLDVAIFIRRGGIKTEEELLAESEKLRESGNRDLQKFVVHMGEKGRNDIIKDAWKIHHSIENVKVANTKRLDLLRQQTSCVCPDAGLWLALAYDVLEKNGIDRTVFSKAIYNLLEDGRKKHRNLILCGERNTAKTFLLEPLTVVYENYFGSPAASTFGWLGVDKAQIIYLNDFRWTPIHLKGGSISWDALLRLLEGANVKLPAPMNSCAQHIELTPNNDIPIFCTTREPIRFFKDHLNEPQTEEHHSENRMMDTRWNVFKLTHVFEAEDKIDMKPCGLCFKLLVLSHSIL